MEGNNPPAYGQVQQPYNTAPMDNTQQPVQYANTQQPVQYAQQPQQPVQYAQQPQPVQYAQPVQQPQQNIVQNTVVVSNSGGGAVVAHQDYMCAAILVCLFCAWPCGIVAIIQASNANAAALRGDQASALSYNQSARCWIIISIISAILIYVVWGIAQAAVGGAAAASSSSYSSSCRSSGLSCYTTGTYRCCSGSCVYSSSSTRYGYCSSSFTTTSSCVSNAGYTCNLSGTYRCCSGSCIYSATSSRYGYCSSLTGSCFNAGATCTSSLQCCGSMFCRSSRCG